MKIKSHRTRNNKYALVDFHKRTMNRANMHRTLEADKDVQPEVRVLRFDRNGKRIEETTR